MANRSPSVSNASGFTIIEILIAASVGAILIASLVASLIAVQRSALVNEARSAKASAIEALHAQLLGKQLCMKSFVTLPTQFAAPAEVAIKLSEQEAVGSASQPINNTVRAGAELPLYSSIYTESLQLTNWQEIAKPSATRTLYSSDLNWTMHTKKFDTPKEGTGRQQLHPAFVARVIFEVENGAITSCHTLDAGSGSKGEDGLNGVDTLCEALGGTMKDEKCIPGTASSSSSCYNQLKGVAGERHCAKGLPKPIPASQIPIAKRSDYTWNCYYKINGGVQTVSASWANNDWQINEGYEPSFNDKLKSNGQASDCMALAKIPNLSEDSLESGTSCQIGPSDGCHYSTVCTDGSWIKQPGTCPAPDPSGL